MAREQVIRLVQREYHDVEPSPIEALVGETPDDLDLSGDAV
jgi:hypothetical protein